MSLKQTVCCLIICLVLASSGSASEGDVADYDVELLTTLVRNALVKPSSMEVVRDEIERGHPRTIYDLDEAISRAKTLTEATNFYGAPQDLAAALLMAFQSSNNDWDALTLAQRYRILDLLLLIMRAGDDLFANKELQKLAGPEVRKIDGVVRNDKNSAELMPLCGKDTTSLGARSFVFVAVDHAAFFDGPDVDVIKLNFGIKHRGWPPTNMKNLIWSHAISADRSIYAIFKFDTVFTAQEPSILGKTMNGTWSRVETPNVGVLRVVALDDKTQQIAVGTESGHVLLKSKNDKWKIERVFENDRVDGLFYGLSGLVAVSQRGGVAFREETWKFARQPVEHRIASAVMSSSGKLSLLTERGCLEEIQQEKRAKINWKASLPKGDLEVREIIEWNDRRYVNAILNGWEVLADVDTSELSYLKPKHPDFDIAK